MDQRWTFRSALAGAAIPALLPLWVILRFGVDVPFWDQWGSQIAGLYIKAADGQLRLEDFTAQHNEHRIVVPRFLGFLLNLVTRYNVVGEMLFAWFVVCLTSAFTFLLARTTIGRGQVNGRVVIAWFLSNLMLFTLAQRENWLWGMGLINVMPQMFFIGAMVVLASRMPIAVRFSLAMLACAAAMFSSGHGLIAFPLVGLMLAWSDSWQQLKSRVPILIAWAVGFFVFFGMFLYGYARPAPSSDIPPGVVTFMSRVQYFLAFIGNPFATFPAASEAANSILAGVILLTVFLGVAAYFLLVWRRGESGDLASAMLPWLLLGLFTIFNALTATLFRANLGLASAYSSRYVTISLYLPVALIHLVPMVCSDLRSRLPSQKLWARFPAVGAIALVLGFAGTVPHGWRTSELSYYGRLQVKATLLLINLFPDNPRLAAEVCPDVPTLKANAHRLDSLGYFRPKLLAARDVSKIRDPRDVAGNDTGAIEQMVETRPNEITLAGWALWLPEMKPVDAIVLAFANERQEHIIFATSDGIILRPDLATAYHDKRYELAGWMVTFPTSVLPPGPGTMTITAWALDARSGMARQLRGWSNLKRDARPGP